MTSHEPFIRRLDPSSVAELRRAAAAVDDGRHAGTCTSDLARDVAAGLPAHVREHCRPVDTDAGCFVLRGLPVDDLALGPTPEGWEKAAGSTNEWDDLVMLLAAAMGRPIAWAGQQAGRFVHDIVPAPGHENEQTGASSTTLLEPHTEDAFHPGRAHLLLLACLRNHDRVATTVASVRRIRLGDADVDQLALARLPILPDDAYGEIREQAPPPPVPTLFEAPDGLALRFDPAYTPLEAAEPAFRGAYGRLQSELERVSIGLDLQPGDVAVLDNDLVVHGRVPFQARYDGTDRWLKRASVRVAGRRTRPAAERHEHGYGQRVIVAGEAAA